MALKPIVDKLEDVPEALRSLYVPKDNKFVIDIEGGYEDVSGLKSAFQRTKTELQSAKEASKRWGSLGIDDPEKVASALKELEELKKIDPASEAGRLAEVRIKSLSDQLGAKHAKEVEALNKRLVNYRKTIENTQINDSALRAITEQKGIPKLLLPTVKTYTRLREDPETGRFFVEILDDAGNVRINSRGDNLTMDEYVLELKNDTAFGVAFEGNQRSGSGAPGPGQQSRQGQGGKKRITSQEAESGKYIDQILKGEVEVIENQA